MKLRVVLGIFTVLFVSCGIWKETGRDGSLTDEHPAVAKTGPAVHVYAGPEFFRESLLEPLIAEYGPEGAGGPVTPFSSVTELADPEHGAIIIAIGADTGIIRPLSRLAEQRSDLRIISLFSLADPVLLEYFSELAVDCAFGDELLASENETRGISVSDDDLSLLLLALVRYADERDWNIPRQVQFVACLDEVFRAAGRNGIPNGWQVRHYVDPETGLRSRNHLILHLPGSDVQ